MRYLFVILSVFILGAAGSLNAQINLNFNVDKQPIWGPTGYDYVEYYYLPDIETYYSVPQHRYYYYNNKGRWIYSSNLPSRYNNFDFYNSYKVVVNEREPWRNHKNYKEKYFSYKGRHDQQLIRDSRDAKYFVIKNHPGHNNWVKEQGNKKSNQNNKKNVKQNKHDNGKNKK
ncbi:MAG: hypothetical protein IH620_03395 [Ignavibacterium sp.]|nr:hypothetical protein [Ignavibacterium sp.]HCY75142.1 hypothetical protein [Ignavibacteriales bacterium]